MRVSSSGSGYRPKTRPSPTLTLAGNAHFAWLLVIAFFFITGGVYIFAVNERAVYGYDIRKIEKELQSLKKENAELRLREAAGRSLNQVEFGSANLRMEKAVPIGEVTVKKAPSVAYR